MGSNKYMITKIKCWPVFKQDPKNQTISAVCLSMASCRKRKDPQTGTPNHGHVSVNTA